MGTDKSCHLRSAESEVRYMQGFAHLVAPGTAASVFRASLIPILLAYAA